MKNKKIINDFISYIRYRSSIEIKEFIDTVDVDYLHLFFSINRDDVLLYILSKNINHRQKIRICLFRLLQSTTSVGNFNKIEKQFSNILFDNMIEHNYKKLPLYNVFHKDKYILINNEYQLYLRNFKIKQLNEKNI